MPGWPAYRIRYITVNNLPRLVALAAALGLDPDHFYVHIIQHIVKEHAAAAAAAAAALPGDTSSLHLSRRMLSAQHRGQGGGDGDGDGGASSAVNAAMLTAADRDMLSMVEAHLGRIRDPRLRVDTAQWWANEITDGMCKVAAYEMVRRFCCGVPCRVPNAVMASTIVGCGSLVP